jgi:uncharacterized membrane protein HdeD (DUF308 family)
MSAGLARNWWSVALRGAAAVIFGLCVLVLPRSALASFVLLFAAYLAADGAFAIVAGARAARRGERWRTLILEGFTNLMVAGTLLIWYAITIIPLLHLASVWAIVTGALMLAAARRLLVSHGRWLLTLAGALSASWGALLSVVGPSPTAGSRELELWLVAYAFLFGVALLALAGTLYRRHQEAGARPAPNCS